MPCCILQVIGGSALARGASALVRVSVGCAQRASPRHWRAQHTRTLVRSLTVASLRFAEHCNYSVAAASRSARRATAAALLRCKRWRSTPRCTHWRRVAPRTPPRRANASEWAPLASNIRRAMSKRAACNTHCATSEQSCSAHVALQHATCAPARRKGCVDVRATRRCALSSAGGLYVVQGIAGASAAQACALTRHGREASHLSIADLVTSAAAGEAARAVGGRHREAARPRARIGAAVGPKLDRFLAEHGASTTRELRPTFASCFAGCGRTHGVTMPSSSHRDGGLMRVLVVPYEAACPF